MERKIGEIFEHNGEWYQCVEGNCAYCSIEDEACGQRIINDVCKLNRIFKKLEKVGEPYEFDGRLFQSYRTFEVPIFTENYATVRELGNNSKISIEIKQIKEDMGDLDKIKVRDYTKVEELNVMEENKLNLKPFDIQKAREGKPVCTRDGRKARIICFDAKMKRNIIALIQDDKFKDEEIAVEYFPDGCFYDNGLDTSLDLMMLPEKRSGWAKIRKDINLYNTKEEADRKMIGNDEYVTAKVCWEE